MRSVFCVLSVVVALSYVLPALGADVPSPASSSSAAQRLIRGNTEFALALYQEMARRDGNIAVSPLSVSIATAMLAAGAEGQTRSEIMNAGRFGLPTGDLHGELRAVLEELRTRVTHWAELSIANGLWIDGSCSAFRDYTERLAKYYDAAPETVSFGRDAEEAAAGINDFFSKQTHGKISSMVTPDMFTDDTRLVLGNAVYFLGAWNHMFSERSTSQEPFYVDGGDSLPVDMMHLQSGARYYDDGSVQVLDLRYQGSGLTMLFVLPHPGKRLAQIEAELSPALLSGWVRGLTNRGVDIAVPRFEISREVDLIPLLRKMGMRRVFDPSTAQLDGLCIDQRLYVDVARHKAVLAITEKGTEAAAATVYKITKGISAEPETVVPFHANRPFLFILEDMQQGTILFIGRFVGPGQ